MQFFVCSPVRIDMLIFSFLFFFFFHRWFFLLLFYLYLPSLYTYLGYSSRQPPENFRLLLTSQRSPILPLSVVRASLKLAYESPGGFARNLAAATREISSTLSAVCKPEPSVFRGDFILLKLVHVLTSMFF